MGGGDFHGVEKSEAVCCSSVRYEILLDRPKKKIFPAETIKMEGTNGPDPLFLEPNGLDCHSSGVTPEIRPEKF
jgi:hypothetical protein